MHNGDVAADRLVPEIETMARRNREIYCFVTSLMRFGVSVSVSWRRNKYFRMDNSFQELSDCLWLRRPEATSKKWPTCLCVTRNRSIRWDSDSNGTAVRIDKMWSVSRSDWNELSVDLNRLCKAQPTMYRYKSILSVQTTRCDKVASWITVRHCLK